MICSLILKPGFRKILRTLASVALTIFSFTLYSCSSSDPYPDEWGYVMDVEKHGDSVISGNYGIQGNCTRSGSYNRSLARILELPGFFNVDSYIDNIVIKLYNEDSLLVLLKANSDTLYKTVFPGNGVSFSVTEDGLKMKTRKNKGGDPGLILPLFSNDNVTLMKGTDSSLIARYNGWGVGLLMMIPVYGSVTRWYKFPQYKNK
jgi:hypothetical protein